MEYDVSCPVCGQEMKDNYDTHAYPDGELYLYYRCRRDCSGGRRYKFELVEVIDLRLGEDEE